MGFSVKDDSCEFPTQPPKTSVTNYEVDKLLQNAKTQEIVMFDKALVVGYQLENGFVIFGFGACVSPENFDIDIGRAVARQQVKDKLWELLGYSLQQSLYDTFTSHP